MAYFQSSSEDSGIYSPPFVSNSAVVNYYFEFPSELVGLLIGFAGRKVAHLEEQTKTTITLLDRTPEPGMKMIHVAGRKIAPRSHVYSNYKAILF